MKTKNIMACVLFVAGFTLAWLIKPQHTDRVMDAAPAAEVQASRTSSRRAKANPAAAAAGRIQGYVDQLTDAAESYDDQKLEQIINDIPISEIPALVEAWKKRAGFSGLDYEGKKQLRKLMQKWYEQDAPGALAWATSQESDADRGELLSGIMESVAERGVDQAMAFAKEYVSTVKDGLAMPQKIISKMNEFDAARMMEVIRAFPRASGNSGSNVEFHAGFDFAEMASKLAADRAAAMPSDSRGYAFFPSNFLEEWAKIDASAAWDWVSKNPDAAPFCDTGDVFKEITQHSGIEVANDLLMAQLAPTGNNESQYHKAWEALSAANNEQQLADFFARMPGQRTEHLQGMAMHSRNSSGSSYDAFNRALVTQMTPAERLQILPNTFGKRSSMSASRRVVTETLQKLGHSPAEIQAMMPDKADE